MYIRCFKGKLDNKTFQNGTPRSYTCSFKTFVHSLFGHDDQNKQSGKLNENQCYFLFSLIFWFVCCLLVWKNEKSFRSSLTSSITMGHVVSVRHARRRSVRSCEEFSLDDSHHNRLRRKSADQVGLQFGRWRLSLVIGQGNKWTKRLHGLSQW